MFAEYEDHNNKKINEIPTEGGNCRKYYICKHSEFYKFSYTDCKF